MKSRARRWPGTGFWAVNQQTGNYLDSARVNAVVADGTTIWNDTKISRNHH